MPAFEMPVCGGCRTCEMACSFHHKREFNPAISSIKILNVDGATPFRVWLVRKGDAPGITGIPCDGCPDLTEPLCLQFCRKRDELKEILDEFRRSDWR
jgi:Fe-S-cluster-containing hydrogenase component 2